MTDAARNLDPTDRKLLDILQTAVPFIERPFATLGGATGITEDQAIDRVRRLKAEKVIRQISAIFDTRSLGYESSLVAAQIDPDHVDDAAAIINQHPGVSHNYLRNHEFNLWYTLAVSPRSQLGLERTVDILHRQSGAHSTRMLPTLRLFKIGVKFNLGGDTPPAQQAAAPVYNEESRATQQPLTDSEIEFVRVMQQDLPLTPAPFVDYARELEIEFNELRSMNTAFIESGRMRRFAAVLHHRKAGFAANAMGIWAVPGDDDEVARVGAIMAGYQAVSHCYHRPTYPDWPYNIFTMVHGKSRDECEQTLAAIAEQTGITDHAALYSSKEYKKVRVRYFTADEAAWEAAHAG